MTQRPIVDTTPIEQAEALDRPVALLEKVAERVLPSGRAREILRGEPLGHALHPLLTDLPIGFWTSANLLDLLAPVKGRTAARRLVAWGVLSTVPTIAAGLNDWHEMDDTGKKRMGTVHAAANATATVLYVKSYLARRRGKQLRGVLWGLAGMTVATGGGLLGGELAFGSSSTKEAEPAGALPAFTGGTATGSTATGSATVDLTDRGASEGGTSDDDRQPADAGATGTLGDRTDSVSELRPRPDATSGTGLTATTRRSG